jgi:branched-chain amino acid transport system ATP-binding protein
MSTVLELRDLTLRFGGLVAVKDVSLAIPHGTVTGLIGPNGAGKSTIFNLITGLYRPSSGDIVFGGTSIAGTKTPAITQIGIARTFQNIRLFAFMSVLDNVMVGRHVRMKANLFDALLHTPQHRREERAVRERARELLAFVGLEQHADREAHSLSYGQQRRLEIARALASDPKLLLLDEPAAGMNPQEKDLLCTLIDRIREQAVTVFLIEHDMPMVMRVCSHLWVLDHGELLASGVPEEVRQNQQVIDAYLGRPATTEQTTP